MIRSLIESAQKLRADFLNEVIELDKGRFRTTDEIGPYSKHVPEFQTVIDKYRQGNAIAKHSRGVHFQVKDVAVKKDSGTASLGLDRFFVLIDGPTDDPLDDIVLELKQTRRFALEGLAPRSRSSGGDPFYGRAVWALARGFSTRTGRWCSG